MHLVARESSKRLINAGYMPLPEPRDKKVRTIGGPNLIVLNESIVYEGLNDLLYRLGDCEASKSEVICCLVGLQYLCPSSLDPTSRAL